MNRIDQVLNAAAIDPLYKGLYKAGGAAALIAALIFRRNLDAEYLLLSSTGIINGPSTSPSTIMEWFTLLQHNPLLGLTLLNVFDLVNYALLGLIFLALFTVLRRVHPSWMILATGLGLSGSIAYIASNQAFTMLSLSRQYILATSAAQKAMFLAAGQAVLAIHQNASYAGSGIYLSYCLVSVAGLIVSTVMLGSPIFSKATAYMGILANGFGLSYYIVLVFAPALVFIPISISAIFLLVWYLLVGIRLWLLGSNNSAKSRDRNISDLDHLSLPL